MSFSFFFFVFKWQKKKEGYAGGCARQELVAYILWINLFRLDSELVNSVSTEN